MTAISVQDWLAKLAPDVRAIAKQLRAVARKKMPKAQEFIYQDAIRYSFTDSTFDQICYILPQRKGYVNFGFFFGGALRDPEKDAARQSLERGRGEESRPGEAHSGDME